MQHLGYDRSASEQSPQLVLVGNTGPSAKFVNPNAAPEQLVDEFDGLSLELFGRGVARRRGDIVGHGACHGFPLVLVPRELQGQTYFRLQRTYPTLSFLVTHSAGSALVAKYVERLLQTTPS
jgi:hypothetical protein